MSRQKELVKNTLIILIGKICTQFLSFFLLPLYTAVLNSSEYGIVDLFTTYVSLLVPLVTLQLANGVFRFLVSNRNSKEDTGKVVTNTIYIIILISFICLIIICGIDAFITIPYIEYLIAITLATIFSNVMLQIARGLGDNIGYSIGSLIAGGLTVILNVLFLVVLRWGPPGMFLSQALANFFSGLYISIKERVYSLIKKRYINKDVCFDLLRYSVPLIPNSIIWWVINVSDRTLIAIFLGTASNGIYAIANKFSSAVMSVYNIFNLSWTESASLHVIDKDRSEYFTKVFNSSIHLFTSGCILITACMPFIFPIMVNNGYQEAYNYIPILMLGTIFNIIVGLIGAIYIALKKTKEIATTSILSGIINFVINILLIRIIGLYAAAISTAVAFGAMVIYRYIDVKKYVDLKIKISTMVATCIILVISFMLYYVKSLPSNTLNVILAFSFFIIVNFSMVKSVVSKIKRTILRK